MAEVKNVINGLECVIWPNKVCGDCSYFIPNEDDPDTGWCNRDAIYKDALSLLKAQEPRVMILEEVKGMKRLTICAVEQRSKVIKNTFNAEYGGIVTLGNENFLDFGLYGDTNRYRRTEAGYGKTWRCWTSRPTDEQRKAVKWDETD